MSDSKPSLKTVAQFQSGCSVVCDVVRKPKRRKRRSRPLHRWLGFLTALPLVWVLLTGVLLNHAEEWGLNSSMVTNKLVLKSYGMMPKSEPQFINTGEFKVVNWDGVYFLNEQQVALTGEFIGAAKDGEGCILVSNDSVLRFDKAGELEETLDELSLPEFPLLAVAELDGKTILKNASGWYQPDENWLECTAVEVLNPVVIKAQLLTDEVTRGKLLVGWSGGGLPWSRVILDLHSGNFLGAWAKYFYDFVALCTLLLIGSGLVLHYRTSKRNRKRD